MRSLRLFLKTRVRSMNEGEVKSEPAYKMSVRIRMRAAVWHYMYSRKQRCVIGCWVEVSPTHRGLSKHLAATLSCIFSGKRPLSYGQ